VGIAGELEGRWVRFTKNSSDVGKGVDAVGMGSSSRASGHLPNAYAGASDAMRLIPRM